MTTEDAPGLVRGAGPPQRATLLELFFDLVFVAAFVLTSLDLARDLSWGGAVKAILPLMAIWWIWSVTATMTDFYDPNRRPIQVLLGAVMVGVGLMAASLPEVFGAKGLLFAGAYSANHVGRGVVLVGGQRRGGARQRAARFLFWFGVSAVPWVGGGFAHGWTRALLWGFGLAIDLVLNGLRYPTPFLGRVPMEQYDQTNEHLGERYQQFLILSLSDMLLISVLRYSRLPFTAERDAAIVVAFATTALFWQIYVRHAGALLQTTVTRNPGRSSRWAPFTHMIMVIGIVTAAAGLDALVRDPSRPTTPAGLVGAIFGGPALFLIGRTTFELEAFGRASRTRVLWLAVMLAAAPEMVLLPPLYGAAVLAAILLATAVSDLVRSRGTADRVERALLRRRPHRDR